MVIGINAVKTMSLLPAMTGNGLNHLFMVIWGMLYSCFTHINGDYWWLIMAIDGQYWLLMVINGINGDKYTITNGY